MKPYKSVFKDDAKQDIKDAFIWYNQQKKGLGEKFTASVRKRLKQIRNNPNSVQVRYSQTHTALIEKFPYMIHFFIDETIIQLLSLLFYIPPETLNYGKIEVEKNFALKNKKPRSLRGFFL